MRRSFAPERESHHGVCEATPFLRGTTPSYRGPRQSNKHLGGTMSHWKVTEGCEHYFVTTTIVDWIDVFTSGRYFEILIDALKYCISTKGLRLHAFVIMLNHAHYIVSSRDSKSISDVMRDFNTFTSRKITERLKIDGRREILNSFQRAASSDGRGNRFKVWQAGYHPIGLWSDYVFNQKLNYIHDNPVRKGYVDEPDHWRFSSARNYLNGDHSVIEVECGW